MVHVDDLVQSRTKKIALSRIASFPWPHRPLAESLRNEGITKQICKESRPIAAVSGKFKSPATAVSEPISTALRFFTWRNRGWLLPLDSTRSDMIGLTICEKEKQPCSIMSV
jgi:hypothetical protein